ncbi:Druantia anti-phage system protein DruA [Acidiferrobacter sp. SPIII_3]|uniref:Druantia anti-phage system protein DruA n=1 Tax=Acidiferrobacter sp. SPIII_3 TaxID=1281578 RepID=UPI00143D1240|nr:Druantia anti-phage system protein DruA [Acidiferrobacter sp. SPIII_3]
MAERFTHLCRKDTQYLGDTQGRGKLDTLHRHDQPIKSIWIYPLTRDFRQQLCKD